MLMDIITSRGSLASYSLTFPRDVRLSWRRDNEIISRYPVYWILFVRYAALESARLIPHTCDPQASSFVCKMFPQHIFRNISTFSATNESVAETFSTTWKISASVDGQMFLKHRSNKLFERCNSEFCHNVCCKNFMWHMKLMLGSC